MTQVVARITCLDSSSGTRHDIGGGMHHVS